MSEQGWGVPEEIRFAVVLNGGVSLAVWMGGVVREIDRVTRGLGPYGRLLDLVNAKARADVIAGTSAGGINGAALALSQANDVADVSLMRDLWAEQGRMDSLLQRPFKGSPASLLRGDDYFLPKLYDALRQLTKSWQGTDPAKRPIELIITTTLLHGARTVTVDSLGQQLPQMVHQGLFAFRRDDEAVGVHDDFAPGPGRDVPAELAIAARCTAGFPVAFEPCFVPARGQSGASAPPGDRPIDLTDPERRPDLGPRVSWRTAGPSEELPGDRSRYAVDGGLLANTPTRAALDAVARMPAGDFVQRVMLLVYPHAPVNRPDEPDLSGDPPTVVDAMGGVLGALLSEGNRTFVDEVQAHNQAAAARRGTRLEVMEGLSSPGDLRKLAVCVFSQYRNQRVHRAARDLAVRVHPPADWSLGRIQKAAETAQREWMKTGQPTGRDLPYVPRRLPTDSSDPAPSWNWGVTAALDVADSAMDLLRRLIGVSSDPATCDRLAAARLRVSQAWEDLRGVRDGMDRPWIEDPVLSKLRPGVAYWTLRLAHYARAVGGGTPEIMAAVTAAEQAVAKFEIAEDDRAWQRDLATLPDARRRNQNQGDAQAEVARLAAFARLHRLVPSESPGVRAGRAMGEIVAAVADSLPSLRGVGDPAIAESAGLTPWQIVFGDQTTDAGQVGEDDIHRRVLARLVWLHVVAWTLADESGAASSHPMDLVQISLQTRNHFAEQSTTADDKVGGMSLNRFGGFLKRSWRMNDWAWGRMDAATMLCQVILSPERLRRRAAQHSRRGEAESAEQFVQALVETLFQGPLPPKLQQLREVATKELQPVYSLDQQDLPASLPSLAALAAWAVHLRAAVEELPSIAAAVKADRLDRANPSSKGELFVAQNGSLLTELDTTTPAADSAQLSAEEMDRGVRALRAFDRAGVGREPLEEEARSDQLIRTAATAASVAVTVADSNRSGFGAIKPVTRTLRGGMLVPYWTILGLAAGGAIARFLALLTLASGAILLALSLLGRIEGWASGPATAIGAGALLTAFGFAALRTGTLLHSVVLLTPLIPLVAFAVHGWNSSNDDGKGHSLAVAGAIFAFALALMLLGSLPSQTMSPVATLYRALDKLGKRYFPQQAAQHAQPRRKRILLRIGALWVWGARFVLCIAVVVLSALALYRLVRWVFAQAPSWQAADGWLWAVTTVLVLAGWAVGYWTGWRLRSWNEQSDGDSVVYRIRGVHQSSGVAATWSVIYGACYAFVAAGLIWWWPENPNWVWQSALATAVVFALLLLYVVPITVLIGSVRRIRRRLVKDRQSAVLRWPGNDEDEDEVIKVLWKNDIRFRCLLTRSTREATTLKLTRTGRRLRDALDQLI